MRRSSSLAVAALAAALLPVGALAQSPAATAMPGASGPAPSLFPSIPGGHPAHIHDGLCPKPGPIVAGLSDVSDQLAVDGVPATGDTMGAVTALPVQLSVTTVKMGVKDIADGRHSINVHQSADQMGVYIACGDAGGTLINGSDMVFGLAEQNGSGFSGSAWIHDRGDGSSTVYLFLTQAGATPGSSMAPGASMAPASMAPGGSTTPASMAPASMAPAPSTAPGASPAGG